MKICDSCRKQLAKERKTSEMGAEILEAARTSTTKQDENYTDSHLTIDYLNEYSLTIHESSIAKQKDVCSWTFKKK